MLATSTQYAAMVEGPDQLVEFKVSITLPGGIYPNLTVAVTDLQIQAATTTDVPAGTRIDEGYAQTQASFTLAGTVDVTDETKTVAWLFGRYQTTSPLYRTDVFRAPVTIDVGLYPDGAAGTPELLRKFTGYVDEYVENSDGTVEFTCVDNRSSLHGTVETGALLANRGNPYVPPVSAEYLVDSLLRNGTGGAVSSWPANRPGCVLSVGMRGAGFPDVGTHPAPFTYGAFAPGLNGSAWTVDMSINGLDNTYNTAGDISPTLGANSAFIEFVATGAGTQNSETSIQVNGTRSGAYLDVAGTGSSSVVDVGVITTPASGSIPNLNYVTVPGLTLPPGSHYVAALVTWTVSGSTLTWSATVIADAATYTISPHAVTFNAATSLFAPNKAIVSAYGYGIEAIQVADVDTLPASNYGFVPKAVLDPSLNRLAVVPAIEGDPWQAIQQLAEAELAVAGFDEQGLFRWRNRHTLASPTAPPRTITSTAALKELQVTSNLSSIVNRAQVGYTTWAFAKTLNVLWSATTAVRVARNSTLVLPITLDNPALIGDFTYSKKPNGSIDVTSNYYRASIDAAGTNEHPGGFSIISSQPDSASKLTITIVNNSNKDVYFVSPANYTDMDAGTPLLVQGGEAVTADNEVTCDFQWPPLAADGTGGAASSKYGETAWQFTGSPWLQDHDVAQQLCTDIVTDSYLPRPDLTNVSIVPDPRIQLCDLVHIVDTDRTGADEYARIFGWTINYSADDDGTANYTMSIDARTIVSPGGWILGVTGRSELGSTTNL